MKTSKSINKLELKKLQIAKIDNASLIKGGAIAIIDVSEEERSDRPNCPSDGTLC